MSLTETQAMPARQNVRRRQIPALGPSGKGQMIAPALLGLVAAADLLLYQRQGALAWLALFSLLAIAIALIGRARSSPQRSMMLVALAIAVLLPLAVNLSILSFLVSATGLAFYSLAVSKRLRSNAGAIAAQAAGFFLMLPFRLGVDFQKLRIANRQVDRRGAVAAQVLVWTLAAVLGCGFIFLFAVANPIVEGWLAYIDLDLLLQIIAPFRIVFWMVTAAGIWAYLRPRAPSWSTKLRPSSERVGLRAHGSVADVLFGRGALLRALVVFNAIFAVQNGLDIIYLWGGAKLPDGLNYAEYAHRGAYALIATALLAAAFVLAAMRPGSATVGDRTIRWLVYAWTLQNLWLVASSILRLDLYVDVYSLTYWRIAAFLWMGLVATGLALIIARIALGKSNGWLMSANLSAASAMLYACCFVNFAALIANYNVNHSYEMTGQNLKIDRGYLSTLGPSALPAIDRLMAVEACQSCTAREILTYELRSAMQDWRNWTFRNQRLMRYLDSQQPVINAPQSPDERHNGR